MKNKVVTIVCVVLMVLAILCFGYIFLNSNRRQKNVVEDDPEEIPNEVVEEREEKPQNIVLNSRVGVLLKNVIKYSNTYSEKIVEEIDANGVSNRAKLLIALDKLFRTENYSSYSFYSETSNSRLITGVNMQNIVNDFFINKEIQNTTVDNLLIYDATTDYYIIGSTEIYGDSINYVVEIPYKMSEYSDRVELEAYRIYVVSYQDSAAAALLDEAENVENDNETINDEDIDGQDQTNVEEDNSDQKEIINIPPNLVADLYYDKARTAFILKSNNSSLLNEQTQIDYIKGLIDNGTIDTSKLEAVQYTIKLENTLYKIEDFKKL